MNQRESELVIYCPYCSSIQEVGHGRSCCPERAALIVPRIVAEQARESFASAIEEKYQAENDRLAKQVSDAATMWTEQCAENEKYLELIGMLRNALEEVRPYFEGEHHPDHPACKIIRAAIDATQATADAWEAEVKARAIREFVEKFSFENALNAYKCSYCLDRDTDDGLPLMDALGGFGMPIENASTEIELLADWIGGAMIYAIDSRIPTAQPEQPRKPCTCDGWCDGFCLEKEGKRK